jgi:hypothetical protein
MGMIPRDSSCCPAATAADNTLSLSDIRRWYLLPCIGDAAPMRWLIDCHRRYTLK